MIVTEQITDARTGLTTTRQVEIAGVMTEAEGIAAGIAAARLEAKAAIVATMQAADLAIIRALTEGDTARILAHVAAQAALRATL
tara:strand:+ start:408 stop:662 length:255 start_codon:yes stop_codon:yes gene_type:complete